MSLIYWDTMLFVYLFEGHPEFEPKVRRIWNRMHQHRDILCTSTLTVGEALTGPLRQGKRTEAEKLRTFFHNSDIRLIDFRLPTAELFADFVGKELAYAGDAIHLACAAEARVDLFLTNDKRLSRKIVPGIQFIADLDNAPL